MRWRTVVAIARRDLSIVLRNRGVRIPLLVAPALILIVLPAFLVGGEQLLSRLGPLGVSPDTFGGLAQESERISRAVGDQGSARWVVFVLEVFTAPLYLLVPLMTSTVIAADSFAGERDRGTLEALLHTPTSDEELLAGKFLATWIPAVVLALGGLLLYSVVANALAWPELGYLFFPNATWLILGLWVAPGLAALGLSVMVFVSSRVQSVQAAHQIGSLLVLPVLLMLIGQVTGITLFDVRLVLLMGSLVWIAAAVFLLVASGRFERDRLAARL